MESIESVRICVCLTGLTMGYGLMSLYTKQLEKRGINTALHRITTHQNPKVVSFKNAKSILSKIEKRTFSSCRALFYRIIFIISLMEAKVVNNQ